MTKKFTESIFILVILNLLVKPFWIFGIDRTIQNKVGADQYGLYFSLFSFSLLFNIVADLGITNYNNRNIARNHAAITGQVGHIIPIKLLLGGIYAAFTLIAAFYIGYSSFQFKLLIWLTINQVLVSGRHYLRSNISGLQLFKTDSVISIIDKFLLIIICGCLLWLPTRNEFKIEWLIYSETIVSATTLFITLAIVITKTKKIKFDFNLTKAIHTLKKSFPFAILIFLMVIYTRVDAVMLERMLPNGKTEAGIYAQAFRILNALSMFALLFASILLPLFAKMIKDKEPIIDTLGHSFALLMIPTLGVSAGLFLNAEEFMQLLYHQHTEKSHIVLQFLMIGFIGISASTIFGTLLTAAGKLKTLNRVALGAVILNVILNFILIPKYGANGAAFSSMLTQLIMGFFQGVLSITIFKIKILPVTIVKYTMLTILLSVCAFMVYKLIDNWYISLGLTALAAVLLGFVFNVLKVKHFNDLFLKEK